MSKPAKLALRKTPLPRFRQRPRRGRERDPLYLAWLAQQTCLVCRQPATVHHVRRYGEPKQDRRTVPLCPTHHQIQAGPYCSIEALGKRKFEAAFGVDLEAAIVSYNERYDQQTGKAV
jgi:hypothetical protein